MVKNMLDKKISLKIKGGLVRDNSDGDCYFSSDPLIIAKRQGCRVCCGNDRFVISSDVTGIDKIYFTLDSKNLTVSDSLRDFKNPVDKRFLKFQLRYGYVPYPFTILEGVMRAPQGIRTIISRDPERRHDLSYEPGEDLAIFSRKGKFSKKDFRKNMDALFLENFSKEKGLLSSFSGGFDSLMLTFVYRKQCAGLIHFSEDNSRDILKYKSVFPEYSWSISDSNEQFSKKDLIKYFRAVDEPLCDSAGFAEYLLLRKISGLDRNLAVMNGQGADALYCNYNFYFKEFISSLFGHPIDYSGKYRQVDDRKLYFKAVSYLTDTKSRFLRFYLQDHVFGDEVMAEINRLYSVYEKNIVNDSANFLGALHILMRNSIHGIEKIRIAARSCSRKYFLPFMCSDVISYSFSVPARFKVGYKYGKKILKQMYPEAVSATFDSKSFLPDLLKKRLLGDDFSELRYNEYFFDNWQKCKNQKLL